MTEALLHLVSDPDDAIDGLRLVESLVEVDTHRVLVRLTPGGYGLRSLSADIAESLGRRSRTYPIARSDAESWAQLAAWLIAEEINEIFVVRAHLMSTPQCERLIGLACVSGARLWLVAQADPLPLAMRRAATLWPMERFSMNEFQEKWQGTLDATRAKSSTSQRSEPPLFPEVPHDDFSTFWHSARALLEPDDFAVFDRKFREALQETRRWIRTHGSSLDEESVAAFLRALLGRVGDRNEALTTLRAAQVALFTKWVYVKADIDRLVGGLFSAPPRCLSNEAASRLRSLPHAREAALAAVALATPLEPAQIQALRLNSVSVDGAKVVRRDMQYAIPPSGAQLLRAHRLTRLFHGARERDQLFGYSRERDRGELTQKGIRALMRTVSRETGLFLAPHWTSRGDESARRWIARRGITVRHLSPKAVTP